MMPVTRARTSTSFEPAVWPTYSNATGKLRGATETTLTSAGGKPAKAVLDCDWPQPARTSAAITPSRPMIRPHQKRERMSWLLSRERDFCGATCMKAGDYIQSCMFVNPLRIVAIFHDRVVGP